MTRSIIFFALFVVGLSTEVVLLARQGRLLSAELERALASLHATQAELAKALSDRPFEGAAATPFELTALDGETVSLGAGPSFVVFFSTTCPACNDDAPIWGDLYRDYAESGVRFVGICVDDVEDDSAALFADRFGVDFPVIDTEDPRVALAYRADYLPRRVLIDAPFGVEGEGEVRAALDALIAG